MPKHEDFRQATKQDIQAMLLNQLITINALYYAHRDERDRLVALCKQYGISVNKIRETIRR